ncbi:hypothetical protein [Phreatobacter oligotrophus]|uniref:Uncharacterized protein n=1 Tax=Phreatobacter oligotrophus TaxID=1122261 RepID=A0A2T4ZIW3_9HYPH|nr:hypothetical protein [Phreatobacter oligotrophus]PTM61915.1 hypothetical protein C8P69_101588 [Phreatobacter oligotrophus]
MTINTSTRPATIEEIAAEMDRRGIVIESLEATIATLTERLAEADGALATARANDVRSMDIRDVAVALPDSEADRLRRICEQALAASQWEKRAKATEAALALFADIAGEGAEDYPDDTKVLVTFGRVTHHALTLGDLRRAAAVYAASAP